eukprot:1161779-Pelagomonas_calceolata.AAC.6
MGYTRGKELVQALRQPNSAASTSLLCSRSTVLAQVLYHGMSEEELPQYDEKADLWSAGVLLFEALTGQQPFMADNIGELTRMHQQQLSQKNSSGIPLFLANQKLAPLTQQFIAALLQCKNVVASEQRVCCQKPVTLIIVRDGTLVGCCTCYAYASYSAPL